MASDIAAGESYAGGAGTDTLAIETGSLVDISAATIGADVENLTANGAIKIKATQLGGFQSVQTGAITLTSAGVADLTGASVFAGAITLAAAGNTLNLTGAINQGYTVIGGIGVDIINGGDSTSAGDDLRGGGNGDTISGGAGNDRITGGTGADLLNGGTGDDTFVYAAAGDVVGGEFVAGGDGVDTVSIELGAGILDISAISIDPDVEALSSNGAAIKLKSAQLGGFQTITASAITLTNAGAADLSGADVINATTFTLSASGNTLDLSGVSNSTYTVIGGNGKDTITGGDNAAGDDLRGGANTDTINGGAGNDIISGGAGADTLDGGLGDDAFVYTVASDIVVGEVVNGGDGFDTIRPARHRLSSTFRH